MKSAAHPSIPEHRATSCRRMTNHTRDYVKAKCDNDTILSVNTYSPSSIKRFAPHNIHAFKVNNKLQCISKALLKHVNKFGDYTVAQSYQRDAFNDEWPELIGSTGMGNFRIPYHVAEECDTKLKLPPANTRRKPPHETRYS
jgi:hypothetical protein